MLTLAGSLVTLGPLSTTADETRRSAFVFVLERVAGLEVHMAGRLRISFKQISKQLEGATKRLRSIRPHVVPADRRKIDLQIKELLRCDKVLSKKCKKMNHVFRPVEDGER